MDIPSGQTIFISYSHKDKRWFELLKIQLGALMVEGLFNVWSDQSIQAGEDWYAKILQGIAEARVAILLISADFLTSDFVRKEEIPRLLQRRLHEGMTIIPVICRPCPWRQVPWLSAMQVRPRGCRPLSASSTPQNETEFASIAEEVAAIIREAAVNRQ